MEANEGYWKIRAGFAEGTIIGGNLGTFNLLLGTSYRPRFAADTILFVEDTESSPLADFERNLQALIYQDDFKNVKGLVIGRFQKGSTGYPRGAGVYSQHQTRIKRICRFWLMWTSGIPRRC